MIISFIITPQQIIPPVEVIATVTSVFAEVNLCESLDTAHNWQISNIFKEVDYLLKLVRVNKQRLPIILLIRNLEANWSDERQFREVLIIWCRQ